MDLSRLATVTLPGEGTTVGIVGDVYRYLATGKETDGKYALMEAIVSPGGGPPPHVHTREEEAFYLLEGEITFWLGEERRVLSAGMFANVPTRLLHAFRNESEKPARMLILVAPAGLEQMFLEVGQLLPPGTTVAPPPSAAEIEKLLAVAPGYGVEIRVPPH